MVNDEVAPLRVLDRGRPRRDDLVDSAGETIEFMLGAKRDISAAKRFFKKPMRADHRRLPFAIGTDRHASYPEAFSTSVKEKVLPKDCKLRRVKYLNNIIEQEQGRRPEVRVEVFHTEIYDGVPGETKHYVTARYT